MKREIVITEEMLDRALSAMFLDWQAQMFGGYDSLRKGMYMALLAALEEGDS